MQASYIVKIINLRKRHMLVIEVVATILKQDDKVLIAERNRGQFDVMFELPGRF